MSLIVNGINGKRQNRLPFFHAMDSATAHTSTSSQITVPRHPLPPPLHLRRRPSPRPPSSPFLEEYLDIKDVQKRNVFAWVRHHRCSCDSQLPPLSHRCASRRVLEQYRYHEREREHRTYPQLAVQPSNISGQLLSIQTDHTDVHPQRPRLSRRTVRHHTRQLRPRKYATIGPAKRKQENAAVRAQCGERRWLDRNREVSNDETFQIQTRTSGRISGATA